MDIHRCRFVPYQPQAINALAFSHASNPKQHTPKDLRLALGRENGDLEIWNPIRGEWVQEQIFRGSVGRTIEQVQWTQELIPSEEETSQQKVTRGQLRLFSSGGSSLITEWDLEKGIPKAHAESNATDIWCFAPQPQWSEAQVRSNLDQVKSGPAQLLAAGCSDGSIVLFSTDDNELRFDRVLTRPHIKKSRCISICWRDRNTIVAGFEESVIRLFDVRNKQMIRQLSIGKSQDAAKPLVWAVKCLPNGTILSGDSSGELKIWDAQNYSLVQRLKTHNADILDITTNTAGNMILTCGVDRRTVAYAPHSATASTRTQRWHEVRHRRFHEHDVKTITSFESRSLSIAVSGGVDTVPIVLPLKNWDEDYHRSLPHLPQRPQMSVSTQARLLLTWWGRDLYIWFLPQRYREPSDQDSIVEEVPTDKLLGQIQLSGEEHITSAAVSNDGSMIVAATNAGVKAFQVRRATDTTGCTQIRSRPLTLPRAVATQGASTLDFSPDDKWLCAVRLNNVLAMVKIISAGSERERPTFDDKIIKLDRKRRKSLPNREGALGSYARHISSVAFSSDSRVLAVGDLSGSIDTWILEGHEIEEKLEEDDSSASSQDVSDPDSDSDSDDETDNRVIQGQKWIRTPAGSQLPFLESAVLALTFKPSRAVAASPINVHGNDGLHATRQNHHPVSPEHPAEESGLLMAVTSNHQIVEFDTINCRLSDWTRRNPSSMLPEHFRRIKDRVMGIWFDKRPGMGVERLWVYGITFIYMFDLTLDLTAAKQSQTLVKVGRLGEHILEAPPEHAIVKIDNEDSEGRSKKRRRRNDGAGDEMRQSQKYTSKVKVKLSADDGNTDVEMKDGLMSPPGSVKEDGNDDEDVDMDEDAKNNSLMLKRRGIAEDQESIDEAEKQTEQSGPATWHTFQYRGILGACALQESLTPSIDAQEPEELPEVLIVERPTYDVELIPRFVGGQEWD